MYLNLGKPLSREEEQSVNFLPAMSRQRCEGDSADSTELGSVPQNSVVAGSHSPLVLLGVRDGLSTTVAFIVQR